MASYIVKYTTNYLRAYLLLAVEFFRKCQLLKYQLPERQFPKCQLLKLYFDRLFHNLQCWNITCQTILNKQEGLINITFYMCMEQELEEMADFK